MIGTLLNLLLQSAPAPCAEPTIGFHARVRAERLEVGSFGVARVQQRANPGVTVDRSSRGDLPCPLAPDVYENVDVSLDLRATNTDVADAPPPPEF